MSFFNITLCTRTGAEHAVPETQEDVVQSFAKLVGLNCVLELQLNDDEWREYCLHVFVGSPKKQRSSIMCFSDFCDFAASVEDCYVLESSKQPNRCTGE